MLQPRTNEVIGRFIGPYRWLSNFWPVQVEYRGYIFPTVEHAYQAAKTEDGDDKAFFMIQRASTPGAAKRLGRNVKVRDDWEGIKVGVMHSLLLQKFAPGTDLANKLVATYPSYIEEGNPWGDTFWGKCKGKGMNMLGLQLMGIRLKLRAQQ